jgi:hypothetical protein
MHSLKPYPHKPLFVDQKTRLPPQSRGEVGTGNMVKYKVSSPCIDNDISSSAYSNEPEDNLNRINIGRYGNTTMHRNQSTEIDMF